MIDQELEPRHLGPGLRSKQLLGIGAVAEGGFLKPKKVSTMARNPPRIVSWSWSSSTKLMPVGSGEARELVSQTELAVDDRIDQRATPCDFPWK